VALHGAKLDAALYGTEEVISMKIGDKVKIIGKYDGYPFAILPWELGDVGYIKETDGVIAFLSKEPLGKLQNGAFDIHKDLEMVDDGSNTIESTNPNATFLKLRTGEITNACKTFEKPVFRY